MERYLKLLVYILPVIVVGIVSKYVFRKKDNKDNTDYNEPSKKEKSVLKVPSSYRFAFVFPLVVLLVAIVAIILTDLKESWPVAIIFGVIAIPCFLAIVFGSLWRVEIRDEEFEYRNWFGKKKVYRYDELELRYHPKGLKWYFYKGDKKVFTMAYFIENGSKLERCWKKRSKKSNNQN